jgi:UDP-N-acetylmuramoyl-tripeptide--D-alanyl-D-alanine ligase
MWQSQEIARVAQGKQQGTAFAASSVVIDSRMVTKGALFVALRGERVDGHDYVKDALAQGAAGALVERVPAGLAQGVPLVVVKDALAALGALASAARARTQATIIAVTGSVGKTGAKEAIRQAALPAGNVFATQGNFNNHIGLPLCLSNLLEQTQIGVFELGMNHAGEIAALTRIVRPHIAVITNVEAVHLEFFADVGAIADAKAEIMQGMDTNGTIVLNRDNPFYERLLKHAQAYKISRVVTFGAHEKADYRLLNYKVENMGSQVEALLRGKPLTYRLSTVGRHYALTSLAALAAVTAAGVDLAQAAESLSHFREPEGRGRISRLQLPQGPITLIDDCYNASPVSMQAGFAKLAELQEAQGGKGRKIAVLGDMLELGQQSAELHTELAASLDKYGVDKVYVAGLLMQHLFNHLSPYLRGAHTPDSAMLATMLPGLLMAQDVVLVKGSHGSHMERVRDALSKAAHHPLKEPIDAV